MRTLSTSLILACVVALTGGAAAPDIVSPGQRYVNKDMRVDPGDLLKTHFVFVLQNNELIEVTKETAIRAYLFQTRIYAVPLEKKAEAIEAVKRLNLKIRPRRKWSDRSPLLPNIPHSELLESRESVRYGSPIPTIEDPYNLTGIEKGKLVVKKTRRLLDKAGKELTAKKLKKARQSYVALLGLVSAVGVVGLGFAANGRGRTDA